MRKTQWEREVWKLESSRVEGEMWSTVRFRVASRASSWPAREGIIEVDEDEREGCLQ